jgi:hypothetical protein
MAPCKSDIQKSQLAHYRKYGKFVRALAWAINELATFKPEHPKDLLAHAESVDAKLLQKGVGGKDRLSSLGHRGGLVLQAPLLCWWRRGSRIHGVESLTSSSTSTSQLQ